MQKLIIQLLVVFLPFLVAKAQQTMPEGVLDLNKPARLEWLQDAGFGMFIHFSFDSQLGTVISHSVVGASDDYANRFFNELPKSFNPRQWDPAEIAKLARLAGMKYIVLTTKHHSGFCLWDTQTTDFKITNTPYEKDLVAEYVEAVRAEGLAVGFYFSPEDFHFLYRHDQTIRRRFPEPLPDELMDRYVEFTAIQITELMSNYGQVDVMFFDGGEGPLQETAKEVAWKHQPDLLVTRGAINTPEQTVPGQAFKDPWEACITMGTQWQYKPTNDDYKSATRMIEILIESRAKGGALLLNVGPKPDGALPVEQENRLREMAAWYFINQEAVQEVRPWIITNEEKIWFTRAKDDNTVFAYLTNMPDWPRGERREIVIHSVKATDQTKVSVLGQNDLVVEYDPAADATTRFEQQDDGLHISLVRAQRIYNNHKWHNPLVVKITNAEPALDPPFVQTKGATLQNGLITFEGELVDKGDARRVEAGFLYRPYAGFAENLYDTNWKKTQTTTINKTDAYTIEVAKDQLEAGEYEYRAWIRHPRIDIYGDVKRIEVTK